MWIVTLHGLLSHCQSAMLNVNTSSVKIHDIYSVCYFLTSIFYPGTVDVQFWFMILSKTTCQHYKQLFAATYLMQHKRQGEFLDSFVGCLFSLVNCYLTNSLPDCALLKLDFYLEFLVHDESLN